ncbi:alpha/beta fold hydrolase [Paenibacillus sp. 1001270B_150601_E10]|uniref:alpha/beta fold hydrolase n=1 Tax=Paenibacillus sp. 1001270B_150601_E10 TaxID=2787079 RepID=UPI00189D0BF0|nr:alpha/beta hydrolase [Paenibacillus sp. 1001270B_150601_E10]
MYKNRSKIIEVEVYVMDITSNIIMNGNIGIHMLDSIKEANVGLVPLVISPGLSETAEEYMDFMEILLPRRVIVLSYRGRGQSDTPDRGYALEDHVSDLAAVVQQTHLERFHLLGYSRGVSYALGYAEQNRERLRSLILVDYPAVHKQMEKGWAEAYINHYLIPHQRTSLMRQQAVRGIGRESVACEFAMGLQMPVLVMRGLESDSFVSDKDLDQYRQIQPNLQIRHFPSSGHDIRHSEPNDYYETIAAFLHD